jgi:hypothetical protein
MKRVLLFAREHIISALPNESGQNNVCHSNEFLEILMKLDLFFQSIRSFLNKILLTLLIADHIAGYFRDHDFCNIFFFFFFIQL